MEDKVFIPESGVTTDSGKVSIGGNEVPEERHTSDPLRPTEISSGTNPLGLPAGTIDMPKNGQASGRKKKQKPEISKFQIVVVLLLVYLLFFKG